MNSRRISDTQVGVSVNEVTELDDLNDIFSAFGVASSVTARSVAEGMEEGAVAIPAALKRTSPFMTHSVFNTCHTEHEMMRFLKRLESRDLGLNSSMIPLGSCTMKVRQPRPPLLSSSSLFLLSLPSLSVSLFLSALN